MKISKAEKRYSISDLTLEEFTAIIIGLSDYSEKRGIDTAGYNMLCKIIGIMEQTGNNSLANSIKARLPEIDT